MFQSVPFECRVALLLSIMAVIAAIDWLLHRQNAKKWREYGFVIVAGVVGTIFGLLNDLITSSISPEYFVFGKGLDDGAGLTIRAGVLGMKAGCSMGAIAGAVCLYFSTRNPSCPPLAYRRLVGFLWRPVALAATAAGLSAICFRHIDPFHFSADLTGIMGPQQISRFLLVWWMHAGVYFGLLLSIIWILVDIVRQRKRLRAFTV